MIARVNEPNRLRKPSLRDPRFIVGAALVIGSMLLGQVALSAAAHTQTYWAARSTLVPGQRLDADLLDRVEVQLGTVASRYLPVAEPLPDAVLTAVIPAGELLTRSTLTSAETADQRAVGLPVTGSLPADLTRGARVDVWLVPSTRLGAEPSPPRQVASAALVTEIANTAGLIGGGTATLHVLVPVSTLPEVLAAIEADGSIRVVTAVGG